ncbi:hypothetical protein GCM10010124_33680 [Pilimelia terevasa]|uniref:Replication initiation protein n=1 Tax=Pilimelia terevasa TaxID=53372 RepID=A0A8J3BPE6_9ACTN|nr:replication initiator [Pilimelia terevasa]GGK38130.1 hypothetical protein GCM10010124_33680 [Pilimelia terevasa]
MPVTADQTPRPGSRAARLTIPLKVDVLRDYARELGVCLKPVLLRRIDTTTGVASIIEIPCGARLASKCTPCAERNRRIRLQQIRGGWHLDTEPIPPPEPADDEMRALVTLRADLEHARAHAGATSDWPEVTACDEAIAEVENLMSGVGLRGTAGPTTERERQSKERKKRTTRRREDAPELPSLTVDRGRTIGRAFTTPDGRTFRPSMFLTLTLDSYGPVHTRRRPGRPECGCGVMHHRDDPTVGTPLDPDTYDYRRAALDAIHGAKIVDRFWQNLRRATGINVQYAGSIELQRRLAPHWHFAMRGTFPRRLLAQVAAATYHQVWWPPHDQPVYSAQDAPTWNNQAGGYVDPRTGDLLPTWDQAMDDLDAQGADAEPAHVVWLGKIDAKGVNAGSQDAERTIRYVTKYIAKDLTDTVKPGNDRARQHFDRLHAELVHLPCTPSCPNWLLYGIQPANCDGTEKRPGLCRGKVHRRETLGFTGRRVLISRQWADKTLTDIREDNRAWVRALLADTDGEIPDGPVRTDGQYVYEFAKNTDADVPPLRVRLMTAIATRSQWRQSLEQAKQRQAELSATEEGKAA